LVVTSRCGYNPHPYQTGFNRGSQLENLIPNRKFIEIIDEPERLFAQVGRTIPNVQKGGHPGRPLVEGLLFLHVQNNQFRSESGSVVCGFFEKKQNFCNDSGK
jgi:hypothetical protein